MIDHDHVSGASADADRVLSPSEEWRPVDGYPGYEVSDLGRARSPRGIMAPVKDSSGYPCVRLYQNGTGRRFKLHRLVCAAFNGPCPEGHECGHLDGDRTNAAASNLAWITRSENVRHAIRHGTHRGFQNGAGRQFHAPLREALGTAALRLRLVGDLLPEGGQRETAHSWAKEAEEILNG